MARTGSSPRERYRSQLRAEIKQHAWQQIAAAGASALSLKAIAHELGVSGPALYRYYAGRDDLLTDLIRDGYRSFADALAATAGDDGSWDLAELGHALRRWALADPQRYLLLYGTPVPGYHAPADTAAVTTEILDMLLAAGPRPAGARRRTTAATMQRALTFWTRLHGVLSLELAGHFEGMDVDPARLYETELKSLLAL